MGHPQDWPFPVCVLCNASTRRPTASGFSSLSDATQERTPWETDTCPFPPRGWLERRARRNLTLQHLFTEKSLRSSARAGVHSVAWTEVLVSSLGGCKTFWSTVWFFSSLPWDGACPDLILEQSQEHSCGKDPYLRAEKRCVIDITRLIKIWSEPS